MKSKKGDAVKLWKLSAHRAFASRSGPIPLPDLLVLGKQFFHTFPFSKGEVFLLPFVKGGGEGFKRATFCIN
jgi:hypothetical protein